MGRIVKLLTVVSLLVFISHFSQAQTDFAAIARNIQPVGQVCLVGQSCAGGDTGNTLVTAAVAVETQPVTVPAAAVTPTPAFDAATVYLQSCFACHSTGAAGAPVMGDAAAWEERMAKGMDTVMSNVINGVNAMPPMGMCMSCSEDDIRSLIDYMVAQGQ